MFGLRKGRRNVSLTERIGPNRRVRRKSAKVALVEDLDKGRWLVYANKRSGWIQQALFWTKGTAEEGYRRERAYWAIADGNAEIVRSRRKRPNAMPAYGYWIKVKGDKAPVYVHPDYSGWHPNTPYLPRAGKGRRNDGWSSEEVGQGLNSRTVWTSEWSGGWQAKVVGPSAKMLRAGNEVYKWKLRHGTGMFNAWGVKADGRSYDEGEAKANAAAAYAVESGRK